MPLKNNNPKETVKTNKPTVIVKTAVEETVNGMVYVEKGITKNIGDYESLRVTIGMAVPVGATKEQLKEARKTALITVGIVDNLLVDEVEQTLNDLGK